MIISELMQTIKKIK